MLQGFLICFLGLRRKHLLNFPKDKLVDFLVTLACLDVQVEIKPECRGVSIGEWNNIGGSSPCVGYPGAL